ncbi:hypothetical protein AB0M28_11685 [Streptomyces sp. NPDC051940]|uniref:hypothetical protein n=1 Tax=Streptomyces sp. NPDC051940 TaxID=3155675 RepID=UPI003417D099
MGTTNRVDLRRARMNNDAVFVAAVDAVDWSAIPALPNDPCSRPELVAENLKKLAAGTSYNQITDAAGGLAEGVISAHSGMVFPAAYTAAPFLLELVEHGQRPRIRDAALELVADSLFMVPPAGYGRVDTTRGRDVPLCCAIASVVRERREVVMGHNRRYGKDLMAEADAHWRLTVEEIGVRPDGISAWAMLEGAPFSTPVQAELHSSAALGHPVIHVDELLADASGEAYAEFGRVPSGTIPGDAVLYRAECGVREH